MKITDKNESIKKTTEITGQDGVTRTLTIVEEVLTAPKFNFGFAGDENTYHVEGASVRGITRELREGYGLKGVTGFVTDGKLYRYENA